MVRRSVFLFALTGDCMNMRHTYAWRYFIAMMPPLWLLLLSAAEVPAVADDYTQSKLDEINLKVEEHSQLLDQITGRLTGYEAELKKLRTSIAKIRADEERLQSELKSKEESRQSLDTDLRKTDQEIIRVKEASQQRVRALFMSQTWAARGNIFLDLLREPESFSRHAYYLNKLKSYDMEVIQKLAELQRWRDESKRRLENVIAQQNVLRDGLRTQAADLQKRLAREEAMVRDIKTQKAQVQSELTALRAQALRLETVVASLTGGRIEETSVKGAGAGSTEPSPAVDSQPFVGQGLKVMKGKLAPPVNGHIVREFGKQRSSEFDEIVLSKGLEYETEPGEKVVAIADGKVIFAGTMPGYRTVVILDHGKRSYSLYGRLADALVHVGSSVKTGDLLAQTSELDHRGRNFYFELRENGAPVNPVDYLRREKKRAS